ncbi:VWA domain-containing protein, partial [Actinoplanes philippinensis]|uniref:VWA domain-containing protein n=1 Tax=Actinoplanes philippinensis TaxID=35752 RepID=UPI0033F0E3D2
RRGGAGPGWHDAEVTVLVKGGNTAVAATAIRAVLSWVAQPGAPDVDAAALLLGPDGKVRGDADFVFYNAPRHTSGAVTHHGKQTAATGPATDTLLIRLPSVESGVDRIALTASTDGEPIGSVPGLHLRVIDADTGTELIRFDDMGATTETAFVVGEVYRRGDAWKFRAVGQGWDTGLAGLAADFGIVVDDAPPPPPAPAPVTPTKAEKLVRLEKSLTDRGDRHLLELTKRAAVSLQKRGLDQHTARVAICLDISLSMAGLYRDGKIQALAERVLALGMRFDDDASIDCFLFGIDSHSAGAMTPDNYRTHLHDVLLRHRLEGGTYYGKAIKLMRRHYFGSDDSRRSPHAGLPVYVMFLTDGATFDEDVTRTQIRSASYEPMFLQFMGIGASSRSAGAGKGGWLRRTLAGGSDFTFLEELDDIPDRYLDNADFFSVADPMQLGDGELFDLLMTEYPGWLQRARAQQLTA